MRRADRMIELVGLLKAAALWRADDLARRLEVSVRTVYRDILSLQAQGVPINGAAGVGYILTGPVDLPPLNFGYDEIEALTLGLAYVEQVGDVGLRAAARVARGKIDQVTFGPTALHSTRQQFRSHQRPGHRAPRHLGKIRRALRQNRVLGFGYMNAKSERSDRTVRPLGISAYSVGWLLVGWCEDRNDFRVFRLDRMTDVMVSTTVFSRRPGQTMQDYLDRQSLRRLSVAAKGSDPT